MHPIVILAAGKGTRLGRALPKPMTELADGRTIIQQQRDNISAAFGSEPRVHVVVGYRADDLVEHQPDAVPVFNAEYDCSNTSKSLLLALRAAPMPGGVLWMNGDVVFDSLILDRAAGLMAADQSCLVVNTASVDDEEIKYTLDKSGMVSALSKTVRDGLGEAVGINYVSGSDRPALMRTNERSPRMNGAKAHAAR